MNITIVLIGCMYSIHSQYAVCESMHCIEILISQPYYMYKIRGFLNVEYVLLGLDTGN